MKDGPNTISDLKEVRFIISNYAKNLEDDTAKSNLDSAILKLDHCIHCLENQDKLAAKEMFEDFLGTFTKYFTKELFEVIFEFIR